jgi:hypothetical protein
VEQPLDGNANPMRIVGNPVVSEAAHRPETNSRMTPAGKFSLRTHFRHLRKILVSARDSVPEPFGHVGSGVFGEIYVM